MPKSSTTPAQKREGKPDWASLKLAFITDPNKPSIREFSGKIGIKEKTLYNRASAERWLPDREEHWERVGKKSGEKIADLQATVTARDIGQQLAGIRAMKETALKFAVSTDENGVVYEKPHEAVVAYERLVKLERLILGESTEHIKVDDARQTVLEMMQIIREEVADHDVLTRLAGRFAQLRGLGGASGAEPDRALN
jgi:hypothetical protein